MKKKYSILILVLFSIILCTCGIMAAYPKINEQAKIESVNQNSEQLLDVMIQNVLPLNYLLTHKENQNDAYDIFITKPQEKSEEKKIAITQAIEQSVFYLENDYQNIDYIVKDKETNIFMNSSDESSLYKNYILNQNKKPSSKDCQIWLILNFNENGTLKYESNYKDLTNDFIQDTFDNKKDNLIITANDLLLRNASQTDNNEGPSEYLFSDYQRISIKNKQFIFAIPNVPIHNDAITSIIDNNTQNLISNIISKVVAITCMVLTLIALYAPFKKFEDMLVLNKLIKLPIEIIILYGGIVLSILFSMPHFINDLMNNILPSANNLDITFYYCINFGAWFVSFLFIFIAIGTIKLIFNKGIKNYFKENTITGKVLHFVIKYLKSFDLSKTINQRIIIVITLNFLFLVFISILSNYNFRIQLFFIFLYSVGLLIIGKYISNKIQEKYKSLKNITNTMANGNLDYESNEELGVFEPLKNDLYKIKDGFKTAVNEEVKSQRMKTELVSNVSHDLKTPLTSIITYVDLLKNNDISEEEKKNYIDILDRNSVRLKVLIEDLFDISKATSGNVSLNLTQIDIVSLMKQILFENNDKISQTDLIIRESYSDEKILLNLDSQKTYRILQNLITNIIKYAMKQSRVYIEMIDYEEQVEISFKNISAQEIDFDPEDIVERFARGDKSRNTQGSGLGLAIAKSFTELQNGSFKVQIDGDLFKVILRFNRN
ncbi:MAG: sensor histidine kinase [Erysipelotrichaceae bacterium]